MAIHVAAHPQRTRRYAEKVHKIGCISLWACNCVRNVRHRAREFSRAVALAAKGRNPSRCHRVAALDALERGRFAQAVAAFGFICVSCRPRRSVQRSGCDSPFPAATRHIWIVFIFLAPSPDRSGIDSPKIRHLFYRE